MKSNVFVIGRNSNLGTVLCEHYGAKFLDCDALDSNELELVIKEAEVTKHDVLVNCVAMTGVDECEQNPSKAFKLNSAVVCMIKDAFPGRFIHLSSDYIFNGTGGPYSEFSDPSPLNIYGKSKLAGEEQLFSYQDHGDTVVRTTILYGGHKPDFVSKIIENLKKGERFSVTTSLIGNPTYVYHLAEAIIFLIEKKICPKVINISGTTRLTRFDFAKKIANVFGFLDSLIMPTYQVSGIAKRPKMVGFRLDMAHKYDVPLYIVDDGLHTLWKMD